jgi:23S rRNA (adenine2503-C2)-methyltransferase
VTPARGRAITGAVIPEVAGRWNLRDLDADQMTVVLSGLGVAPDVARRVFSAVHRDGVTSIEAAQPGIRGLGRAAARAIDGATCWPELTIVDRRRAADGFVKYLFRLPDGPEVEAVRIPLPDPAAARALRVARADGRAPTGLQPLATTKFTVCLSSQAGCALACDFCATGRLGGIRSLETWEIVAQLRLIAAEADHPVRGAVFMGMGEPLLNAANVLRAARIFSHPAGFAIGAKAISISTAGVVPAIRRYVQERQPYRLIFSLGAPTSPERAALMPIENRWPLAELIPEIRAYIEATGQRATIAYVAIGGVNGVNTKPEHARQLGVLLRGLRVKLNLIDVIDDTGRYRAASDAELDEFRDALNRELSVPIVRRYSGGGTIGAACGTLSGSRNGGISLEADAPRKLSVLI